MRYVVMVFASLLIALPAVATNVDEVVPGEVPDSYTPWQGDVWRAPTVVLFENGPLVNSPGTGAGGADESQVLNLTLGMSIYGFGHQVLNGNVIADDFTIPDGEMWDITTITTFAYQTGGGPGASTITAVLMQIWDGVPGVSNVVWGDLATNQLANSSFSNVYRVPRTRAGTPIAPSWPTRTSPVRIFFWPRERTTWPGRRTEPSRRGRGPTRSPRPMAMRSPATDCSPSRVDRTIRPSIAAPSLSRASRS